MSITEEKDENESKEEVKETPKREENEDSPLALGLRFLYENYTDSCWFWEAVDVLRKITLTSGVVFIGIQSRTAVGVTALIAGNSLREFTTRNDQFSIREII